MMLLSQGRVSVGRCVVSEILVHFSPEDAKRACQYLASSYTCWKR
jgi:hypothetical protein